MQSWPNPRPLGYELIDFGRGRKLESFGGILVNRPCPAADSLSTTTNDWESARLIYQLAQDRKGHWLGSGGNPPLPEPWMVEIALPNDMHHLRLVARALAAGQLGVFPEHWQQWEWFKTHFGRWRVAGREGNGVFGKPRILHLFAYTGATTLALAAMQGDVTHVDAMRSAVEWARENSQASQLESSSIRWIVDDARKYVSREARRKKKYDLIVMDPPSYGHGAAGQSWSIQRDLEPLLLECAALVDPQGIGIVLTGHSPDIDLQQLHRALARSDRGPSWSNWETERASLQDRAGRTLDCGYVARFFTHSHSERLGRG
jgi:23S rRNA (cytosine1962-C5)-methyltransferase